MPFIFQNLLLFCIFCQNLGYFLYLKEQKRILSKDENQVFTMKLYKKFYGY